MPVFTYKAKEGPERLAEGELVAESRAEALAALDSRGLVPIWIREKDAASPRRSSLLSARVGVRDVTVFTRQLASLLRAGVPILRSLSTVAEQTENTRFRRVIEDVRATVRDGGMLSDGLSRHAALFSPLFLNMVRSGESAGVLDVILDRLADAREREDETRRRVQAATAYPILILCVGAATVFVLLAFFLPRVVALFRDYQRLPLATRMLIGASDFVSANWHWLLFGALLAAAVIKRLTSAEKGRILTDRIKLRVPLLQRFIQLSDLARFARTLALLVQSGIPIDRALALSASTMRNVVFRGEMEDVRRQTVEQGQPLAVGMKRARHIPSFVSNMVGVGEEAGRLEESLNEVASFYEREFEQLSRLATSLLEPALILVVGAVVGFIVAAMLLPIFQLGTTM